MGLEALWIPVWIHKSYKVPGGREPPLFFRATAQVEILFRRLFSTDSLDLAELVAVPTYFVLRFFRTAQKKNRICGEILGQDISVF